MIKVSPQFRRLEPKWAQAAMGLKDLPRVLDIRTLGLTAAIDLASRPDAVGRRAYDAMIRAFDAENLVIRVTGDTLALTPPLIVSEAEITDLFARVARVIRAVA
jgi:beta-alanine--pyruvate transaminase